MLRLIPFLVCAALAGCGVHSAGGGAGGAAEAGVVPALPVDARAADNREVDLVVARAEATAPGPTTAETIALRLTFANLGGGFTPYGYVDGVLSYEPIRYTVTRDGELVARGEIDGLTAHDQRQREVVLRGQAPGDKVYVITIDSGAAISESDESNNTATVTVRYGGSG